MEQQLFVGETRLLALARVTLPPEELGSVILRVGLREAAGKLLGSSDLKHPQGGEMHLLLSLPGLKAGNYTLHAELLDRSGQRVETTAAPLEVMKGPF
jgi:hypothetical protein